MQFVTQELENYAARFRNPNIALSCELLIRGIQAYLDHLVVADIDRLQSPELIDELTAQFCGFLLKDTWVLLAFSPALEKRPLTGSHEVHIFVHSEQKYAPLGNSMAPSRQSDPNLPRREQEALDIVYALGNATVRDVQAALPDEPSYSATRMLLQRLHKKSLLEVERDGAKYLYHPRTPKLAAGRVALQRLLKTFFDGSPATALSSLLDDESISADEMAELEALIAKAKRSES